MSMPDLSPSGASVYTRGLSRDASTAVGTYSATGVVAPFRWTAATGIELLPTPDGLFEWSGDARAVSGDGEVIAGSYRDLGNVERAFVWRAGQGSSDLALLLQTLGVDTTAWQSLTSVWAVSSDGGTIVGSGRRSGSSFNETFIAVIPEPSSSMLILMGLAFLSRTRRREGVSG